METDPVNSTNATRSRPNLLYGLGVVGVLAVFVLGALTFAAFGSPRTISLTLTNAGSGGLTVSGSATVHAVPDLATLNLGVSSTAPTVKAVRAQTASAANRVLDALHAAGVTDADITTTNISLYENTSYNGNYPVCAVPQTGASSGSSSGGSVSSGGVTILPMPPVLVSAPPAPDASAPIAPPVPVPSDGLIIPVPVKCSYGWTYSENFVVTVRNIDTASDVLDGAIAAGATNVNSVSFDVSKRADFESSARTAAITDAHNQAAKIAAAAGATLGAPISISASFSGPYYANDKSMGAPVAGVATPVNPGTLDISASVTVVYALN